MAHKRPCSFQHSRCSRDRIVGRRILDQENQSLLPESEDFLRVYQRDYSLQKNWQLYNNSRNNGRQTRIW